MGSGRRPKHAQKAYVSKKSRILYFGTHCAIGTHDDSSTAAPSIPTFGQHQNSPFLFQTPTRKPAEPYAWTPPPPPNFSPTKAFPSPAPPEDIRDVDMSEVSPQRPDESPTRKKSDTGRPIATGALRRVYRARQRTGRSQLSRTSSRDDSDDHDDDNVFDDSDAEEDRAVTQTTSNHYTLNMPSAPAPQSDTPYILLGYILLGRSFYRANIPI